MKKAVFVPVGILCALCVSFFLRPAPCRGADPSPETWKEPLTGMEFITVPGGCFMMKPGGDPKKSGDTEAREVCVDTFRLGKREVTRKEFSAFAKASEYRTDAEREGYSWAYDGRWEKKAGLDPSNPGFDQDEGHPVVNVSWNDAKAMADWLTAKSEGRFRLPTEAEWEYACRFGAGPGSRPWENAEDICKHADAADRTALEKFPAWKVADCEDGFVFTAPGARYLPNRLGIHDLLGNVWEWCEDTADSDSYRGSPPFRFRPPSGGVRAVRGGSWHSRYESVSCEARDVLQIPSRRSQDIGFRLLKTP